MGAGASVSDEETVRVMKLIANISGEKNEQRLSALLELSKLCGQDGYKMPLIDGKLLPALVKLLSETGDISANEANAAVQCCTNLCAGNDAKLPVVSEKGMMAALVSTIQRNQGNARYAALGTIVRCANSSDTADYLLDPVVGILNVIAMVITTDTDKDNVTLSFYFLANIVTKSWIPDRINEFLTLDFHVMALNVLKPLGTNPTSFAGKPDRCLQFLMCITAYPEAVLSLKSMGALDVFTPLLALTICDGAIKAALTVAFLAGKEESSSQKVALLQAHPHLTVMLIDLLEAQVTAGVGAAYDRMEKLGYDFGFYPINLVARGVLALSISDANKGALVATKILSLLVRLLQRFHDNSPPISRKKKMGESTVEYFVGGGGDDIAAATAAIETIVQLTFFFDSNTELVQQFITPQSGVEKLFGDLLELSADRQLDREAKGQIHTLLKRLRPVVVSPPAPVLSLAQPENSAAPSSSSSGNTVRKHVMISYAWGAKKELAVALAAELRSLGYEMWRDEEGSAIVPSMSGDTDERMAQAIEASHAVIVCVSPQYKESVNCRSEAQYCKVWKKSHGLQLLYVMMDNEYTTVSKTQTVDGWLGFMLGTELWYPLWSPGNVQSTAIELGKLIGDNAKSDGSSSSAPSSPSKTMVASASSPAVVVSSPPPTSAPPAVDYAKAWSVITDSRRVVADKFDELTAYLHEQGFVESSDLETFYSDEEVMATIRGYLNPVGQKLFIKAMGM